MLIATAASALANGNTPVCNTHRIHLIDTNATPKFDWHQPHEQWMDAGGSYGDDGRAGGLAVGGSC